MNNNEAIKYGPLEMSRPDSPFRVIPQAADALDLYLKMGLPKAKGYLAGEPLTFVQNAKRGLALSLDIFRKRRTLDPKAAQFILSDARGYGTETEKEQSAFNFTLSVFSMMPDYAKDKAYPLGFGRSGILQPPFTIREFQGRIWELQNLIESIIKDKIKPGTLAGYNSFLQRTTQFFRVGRDLPLRLETSDRKEIEEKARDTFEKLLEDIKTDL